MPHFINDNTTLPFPKADFRERAELPSDKKLTAAEWNAVCQAQIDARDSIKGFRYNVKHYGVKGDGATDDRAAIEAALAASAALGAICYFPPGTYLVDRSGANSWCIDVAANDVVIGGERGKSLLKMKSGQPNVSISILRANDRSNVTIRDVVFDGNWGNVVATIDAITGDQDGVDLPAQNAPISGVLPLDGDITDLPTSGTVLVCFPNGSTTTITYTGKSGQTLTGCTGGAGTIQRGYKVLRQDSAAGINHTTQADPKNHAVMLRGCRNVKISDCVFRNLYGDAIWLGISSDDDLYNWCRSVKIVDCDINITARNAISFGAGCEDVSIVRVRMDNYWTCGVDAEPQGFDTANRNITIDDCYIKPWPTFPAGGFGQAIGCVAGSPVGFNHASAARSWRITRNKLFGWTAINNAIDVVMSENTIIVEYDDAAGSPRTLAPIFIDHSCQDIVVEKNWVYDNQERTAASGDPHSGAIHVVSYGHLSPGNVTIRDNHIFPRKTVRGIWVNGQGGFTSSPSAGVGIQSGQANNATSVTRNTVERAGAGWTDNQWAGWYVIIGGAQALIASNDSDTLNLVTPDLPLGAQNAWRTPLGERAPIPTTLAYHITCNTGLLNIEGNTIDCGADGNAGGGEGIYLFLDRAGSRISIARNDIRNCGSWGIHVVGAATKPSVLLEIVDNKFADDQAVATMSACVRFADAGSLTQAQKLILRGNTPVRGLTAVLSNVAAGKWLLNDGDTQQWVGIGVPSHAAPQGSTYVNKSGTGADSFYVNTDGNTTWSAR